MTPVSIVARGVLISVIVMSSVPTTTSPSTYPITTATSAAVTSTTSAIAAPAPAATSAFVAIFLFVIGATTSSTHAYLKC